MDISSATAQVASDLLKAIAILSDTTHRRSAVDQETIKKARFIWFINNPIIYKFFKDFTNHKKKTNCRRLQFLAVDLSPTFLNTGTTNETFQQSGKQDSFRHI